MGMASIQSRITSPIPRNRFAIVSAIAVADNISAKIVAEGISQALLTTAFGLVVAVILQLLQNTVIYIVDNQIVVIQKTISKLMVSIDKFNQR